MCAFDKNRVLPVILAAAVLFGAAAALAACRSHHAGEPSIELPEGSQLLCYPLKNGLISAGYMNEGYEEHFGFDHYGLDIASGESGEAEVLSAGEGTVLGVEFCDNSVGGVVVVRYDNVFCPSLSRAMSLIARYYHMQFLSVKEGEQLQNGQVIGTIDLAHQWYNHCHIELDTDLEHPFNTPQVAEVTSELLIRYPSSGESLLDPIDVLAVREGGGIGVYPGSLYLSDKDKPAYFEGDFMRSS